MFKHLLNKFYYFKIRVHDEYIDLRNGNSSPFETFSVLIAAIIIAIWYMILGIFIFGFVIAAVFLVFQWTISIYVTIFLVIVYLILYLLSPRKRKYK